MTAPQLSDGARELATVVRKMGSPTAAKRVRLTARAVQLLASGARRPSPATRKKLARAFAIDESAWWTFSGASSRKTTNGTNGAAIVPPDATEAPGEAESPPPPPVNPARPTLERYRKLAEDLEATLAKARRDRDTPARDVAQLGQALARVFKAIAELSGEAEVSLAKIVTSRAWRALLDRVQPLLDANPDFAAAFARALEDEGSEP